MDQISDLQAQIVALRLATEGAWLSLLHADQDPVAAAARLKDANVAAVRQMMAQDDVQRAADGVGAKLAEVEGFLVDPFAGERGVAVDEDRQGGERPGRVDLVLLLERRLVASGTRIFSSRCVGLHTQTIRVRDPKGCVRNGRPKGNQADALRPARRTACTSG